MFKEKAGLKRACIVSLTTSALLIVVLLFSIWQNNKLTRMFVLSGYTMGSTYTVTVYEEYNEALVAKLRRDVSKRLKSIENRFSLWKKDSELIRINNTPAGQAIPISEELAYIFKESKKYYELSNKTFNPAILPLLRLSGFAPNSKKGETTQEEFEKAMALADFSSIKLDGNKIIKNQSEQALDFSAIIPGYAADEIASILESQKINNYLINIGGEMRIKGHSDSGWIIGIENPSNPEGGKLDLSTTINLTGKSLATSGTYRKYSGKGLAKKHHIIDPRTGLPAKTDIVSVTTIADTALEADAVSTFLLILGTEEGLVWLKQHPEIDAYFIKEDAKALYTQGFEKYIQK